MDILELMSNNKITTNMKKIKLLTLLMAAPMLWSCSAEDPMPPLTDATEIEDPNFVPLDEAIENATRLIW